MGGQKDLVENQKSLSDAYALWCGCFWGDQGRSSRVSMGLQILCTLIKSVPKCINTQG